MTMADLKEYSTFNTDFKNTVQAGKKAGMTVDQVAAAYKIPERFKGYAMPARSGGSRATSRVRLRRNEIKGRRGGRLQAAQLYRFAAIAARVRSIARAASFSVYAVVSIGSEMITSTRPGRGAQRRAWQHGERAADRDRDDSARPPSSRS
jgi:hypothetical protein